MSETEVGHYQIEQELGRGGMGVVYRARDKKLDRTVALKSVSAELASDSGARARILREAKAAAALDHPYICKVFDTLEANGRLYIVMEYVDGETLESVDLSLEEVRRIGCEIAESLEEAHNRGVVHRDLKPANVMLTRSGHVKIMDFGLARVTRIQEGGEAPESEAERVTLTEKGEIIGSTPYMSPEQLRGSEVDARSDIFSFGILMYELITRHRPFDGNTRLEIAGCILSDEPEPIARYRRGVPEGFERIVRRMLAKDLHARYQSAAEVRRDLTDTHPREALPSLARGPSARGRTLAALAVGVISVSLLLWNIAVREKRGVKSPPAGPAAAGQPSESTEVLMEQARLLSRRLSRSGNDQAIRMLEECIRRSPENAGAHSALALEKLKRFWWYQEDPRLQEEALEKATQALSLDPNLVEARAILAIIKTIESGEPDGYMVLAQCLQTDRSQPEALAWLSFLFLKGGEFPLAQQLIDRLKRERTESPYTHPLQAFLLIQKRDFSALVKHIGQLKREFPDWDGTAYDEALMGIRMPNLPMLQRAIEDLSLINPGDASIKFWQAYLKAGQEQGLAPEDLDSLMPYILRDHEFAALFAQIHARAGNASEALKWLQYSVDKGNYDLIQMNHPDFRILDKDPAFANLKSSLQKKVSRLAAQIKAFLQTGKKTTVN